MKTDVPLVSTAYTKVRDTISSCRNQTQLLHARTMIRLFTTMYPTASYYHNVLLGIEKFMFYRLPT